MKNVHWILIFLIGFLIGLISTGILFREFNFIKQTKDENINTNTVTISKGDIVRYKMYDVNYNLIDSMNLFYGIHREFDRSISSLNVDSTKWFISKIITSTDTIELNLEFNNLEKTLDDINILHKQYNIERLNNYKVARLDDYPIMTNLDINKIMIDISDGSNVLINFNEL